MMRPIYHRPHRTSVALRRAEPRVRRLDARSRLAGVEFLGVCRRKRLQVRCSRPGITRGLAALGPSRFGLSPAPARSETHCSSPSCNQHPLESAICDNIPRYDSHPSLVSRHSPATWANTRRFRCLQMKTISVVCMAFIYHLKYSLP